MYKRNTFTEGVETRDGMPKELKRLSPFPWR